MISQLLACKDKEVNKDEINSWFDSLNKQISESLYKSQSSVFDKNNSFIKPFRKDMDVFDPNNDKWLETMCVYKYLYNLRERLAQKLDLNRNSIC